MVVGLMLSMSSGVGSSLSSYSDDVAICSGREGKAANGDAVFGFAVGAPKRHPERRPHFRGEEKSPAGVCRACLRLELWLLGGMDKLHDFLSIEGGTV